MIDIARGRRAPVGVFLLRRLGENGSVVASTETGADQTGTAGDADTSGARGTGDTGTIGACTARLTSTSSTIRPTTGRSRPTSRTRIGQEYSSSHLGRCGRFWSTGGRGEAWDNLGLMSLAPVASLLALAMTVPPEPQPGWDGPGPESAQSESAPATTARPAEVPAKDAKDGQLPRWRGTGLMIGAGITGAIGWGLMFGRLALAQRCYDTAVAADSINTGIGAATTCIRNAGIGNAIMLPTQYVFNVATWALAPSGTALRGRYDGTQRALNGEERGATGAFIASGAVILAAGIIGRITAAAFVGRPFLRLVQDPPDAGAFIREYRLRMVGVQLSSASIALGASLIAYGAAHRRHYNRHARLVHDLRVAPELQLAGRSGLGHAGLTLTGRF